MSTKNKVKTLAYLKKPVILSQTAVIVDSLKLFHRLIAIADREVSLQESLTFELTQFPLSLFDHKQCMRKPNKAILGKHLKQLSDVIEPADLNTKLIIDGGWLLYQCSFTPGETFGSIAHKYVTYVKNFQKDVSIVFDGYQSSPKDHDHKRRATSFSSNMIISHNTPCTISKARLLANSHNKSQLILLLSTVFTSNGIEVLIADDNADTLIVKTAIRHGQIKDVEVRAEDTDVLCLLIHHCLTAKNKVFITTSDGAHSINKIRENLTDTELKHLLISHSFSGCDTVSSIYGFGKVKVFKIFSRNDAPEDAFEIFNDLQACKENICRAGEILFQYIYNQVGISLNQQRFEKYNKLIANGKFKPEKLPPTPGAANQHALRAYLQYCDWLLLESQSLNPTDYGWTFTDSFEPVGFIQPIAPESILQFISCNCQVDSTEPSCSTNRCSCRKYGMRCIPACGNYHGLNFDNSASNLEDGDSSHDNEPDQEDI